MKSTSVSSVPFDYKLSTQMKKFLTSTIILNQDTSEDNKKFRTSRIMLGSGEDANEPTSTIRYMVLIQ